MTCNPANIAKTYAPVKTKADAIMLQKAGEPSLCALKHSSPKTLPIVKLNIAALDRFLHLKNPLNEEEIDFIAEQIVEEFGCALTFADLNIVLRDAKAGKYGKFYERLSAPDVIDWFRTYYNARLDAAYEINRRQDHNAYADIQSSTDKEQYSNLARIGYGINPDGSLSVCAKRLQDLEDARKEKAQQAVKEQQEQMDKDNKQFREQ